MKLLIFFFALMSPVLVFLTTLLYGGVSNTVLKEELARAAIYTKVTGYLGMASEGEEQGSEIDTIIKTIFTPSYTQTKTEDVIDQSYLWITGASDVAPRVAFPEIKEHILSQYPELLTELEAMTEEAQAASNEGMSEEEAAQADAMNQQMQEQMATFSTFAKNDFSLSLEKQLLGVKQTYGLLKIIQPVLLILLLISLFLLAYLNKTWASRGKWLGSAFLIGGIVGFVAIASQKGLVAALTTLSQNFSYEAASVFAPIAITSVEYFVKTYTTYQGIVSVVFFILSAICFVIASIGGDKKPALTPVKSNKGKR